MPRSAAAIVALLAAMAPGCALMPGDRGAGPAVVEVQPGLAEKLRLDVEALAERIGERHTGRPDALAAAEDFVAASLARAGYLVRWQTFEAHGVLCSNIEAELAGTETPGEIVLVGAHYDTFRGTPGADDNASGVAATLALARHFAGRPQPRTLRFVLFVNEEPPHFWTDSMGSLVYARAARERQEQIVAMLSLESMGYFSDGPGSQRYPPLVGAGLPQTGDFLAFIGMRESKNLVRRCLEAFQHAAGVPGEGAALAPIIPGAAASDHWSFWKQGYPAVMVTGTAPYRNPNYHKPTDTPDTLDYVRLAAAIDGLVAVVEDLAGGPGDRSASHWGVPADPPPSESRARRLYTRP